MNDCVRIIAAHSVASGDARIAEGVRKSSASDTKRLCKTFVIQGPISTSADKSLTMSAVATPFTAVPPAPERRGHSSMILPVVCSLCFVRVPMCFCVFLCVYMCVGCYFLSVRVCLFV